ncbi:glycosyltransferase [Dactylosporangium sp. NPDC051541]|uniref:glycosyltransferase n=1 Tax=Dactylosporangium sp. NPDC051541 TaxID=3363977 RepID=UPI0037B06302
MSRFLFLSLPLIGHVNPMAAVAAALLRRGHAVRWAGSESFLRPLLGEGADIHPIPLRAHRGQAERGLDATRTRWAGYIVPHAKATRKGVEAAVAAFAPDVLVVDQHAIAGAIVAHTHGLRWVSAAPTTMELTRPFRRALPGVEAWIHEQMAAAWTAAGQPGPPPHDLRFSPHGTIAFTAGGLAGDTSDVDGLHLVGPALAARTPDPDFPMDRLDPARKHVLVSMGTLSMDIAKDFYRRVDEALQPLGDRLQAIVVAPERTLESVADHVLVRHRVPLLDLLPHLHAVVSHGGLNTVSEALVHGVPLLIAPIKGDQALNAAAVQHAGAGLRVSFDHIRPDALRTRLLRLLDDPAWAAAARAEGGRLLAGGGAEAAATILESHHHD